MRADAKLVALQLVSSRTKAQDLIKAGAVEFLRDGKWRPVTAVSQEIADGELRIKENETLRYVSRAGLKLAGALQHLGLAVRDWVCLDCGQSTGGFSDCLLQAGAAKVLGFDVGHGQLDEKLRQDSRLIALEGLHIKDVQTNPEILRHRPFDLIVMDLSFISLQKALPAVEGLGKNLLVLVKPQFEVGPQNLKKGVVRDGALYAEVESQTRACAVGLGWKVLAYFPSEVEGREGNREFFLWAEK